MLTSIYAFAPGKVARHSILTTTKCILEGQYIPDDGGPFRNDACKALTSYA